MGVACLVVTKGGGADFRLDSNLAPVQGQESELLHVYYILNTIT